MSNINIQKNKKKEADKSVFTSAQIHADVTQNLIADENLMEKIEDKSILLNSEVESVILNSQTDINISGIEKKENEDPFISDVEKNHAKEINKPSFIMKKTVDNALVTGELNVNENANQEAMKDVMNKASNKTKEKKVDNQYAQKQQNARNTLLQEAKKLEKYYDSSKNDKSDSQEFKDVGSAVKKLTRANENISFPEFMRRVDNLYDACAIYNAKNRGYRWTIPGKNRQKNVNSMLNSLSWYMSRVRVFEGADNDAQPNGPNGGSLVDNILNKPMRIPMNMGFAPDDMEDREYHSLENTKRDIDIIGKLLNTPAEKRKFSDEQMLRLNIMQSRNLSHVFLNEKEAGEKKDSGQILDIKDSVYRIERIMSRKDGFDAATSIEELQGAYQVVIAQCKSYLGEKKQKTDNDKINIRKITDLMLRMQDESRQIDLAQNLLIRNQLGDEQLNEPADLLLLAGKQMMEENTSVGEANEQDTVAAYSLTWEDFQKLGGTKERGKASFENGKIKVFGNSYIEQTDLYEAYSLLTGEDVIPTVANRQMKERFYQLIEERVGNIDAAKDFLEEAKKKLGLDKGESKSLPISRTKMTILMNEAGYRGCKTISTKDNENTAESKAAKITRELFIQGKEVLLEDKEFKFAYTPGKVKKKQLEKNINNILKIAKKAGVSVPKISEHRMDNMINGNLSFVMDEVNFAIQRIYLYANNILGVYQAQDVNALETLVNPEAVKNKIAALCILKYSAESEDERQLRSFELDEYLKDLAIKSAEENFPKLLENTAKMNIAALAEGRGEGVDELLNEKLTKVRSWQNKDRIKDVRKGGQLLKSLCDKMQELSLLKDLALTEGIGSEQAMRIRTLGKDIEEIVYNEDKFALVEMVTKQLKHTRYEKGIKEIKERKIRIYQGWKGIYPFRF